MFTFGTCYTFQPAGQATYCQSRFSAVPATPEFFALILIHKRMNNGVQSRTLLDWAGLLINDHRPGRLANFKIVVAEFKILVDRVLNCDRQENSKWSLATLLLGKAKYKKMNATHDFLAPFPTCPPPGRRGAAP